MTQPMTMRQQAAQMLGVSESATEQEIKRAYRLLVRQAHPDVQGGNPVLFEQLTHATDLLLDRPQAARWSQAPGQAPALTSTAESEESAGTARTVFERTAEVQRGPVVWVRSVIRLGTVLPLAAWCVAALVVASLGWSLLAVASVVPAVVLLVGLALYGAVGRPEWSAISGSVRRGARAARPRRARPATGESTQPINMAEAPTGPIPRMTDERMRQYERTGQ